MITKSVITTTTYSIADGMPNVRHIPHGRHDYDLLYGSLGLEELISTINAEIGRTSYDIAKYFDEPEHKEMCIELRQYLAYLQSSLVELEKLEETERIIDNLNYHRSGI